MANLNRDHLWVIERPAGWILSKHAVIALTETLALECANVGAPIDVSIVIPGVISTKILQAASVPDDEPASAAHRETPRTHVAGGTSPAIAAAAILEGLARNQFRIPTHPDETSAVTAARGITWPLLAPLTLPDRIRKLL